MADDVVLLRRRNDSGVFGPERELVFFDEPVLPERLVALPSSAWFGGGSWPATVGP